MFAVSCARGTVGVSASGYSPIQGNLSLLALPAGFPLALLKVIAKPLNGSVVQVMSDAVGVVDGKPKATIGPPLTDNGERVGTDADYLGISDGVHVSGDVAVSLDAGG